MMQSTHPRQKGVTANEIRQYGDPKTVGGLVKLDMYAILYRDNDGLAHKSVVMIGDDGSVYLPKNGEEWSNQLALAAPWLKDGVEKLLKEKGVAAAAPAVEALPTSDTVDVLGGEVEKTEAKDAPSGQ